MLCEKNPLEALEEVNKEVPVTCYSLQYTLIAIRYYIQSACLRIAEHPLFEAIRLLIIVTNCVILAFDNPMEATQDRWEVDADYVFQALYTVEVAIKVLGMGFVLNENAYLRDPWNILDFIIVVVGYLSMFNLGDGVDLKALRAFRVLRPLRTISSIEELRILINALVTSLPPLMDKIIILMFFFMMFSIIGVQLWHGRLRKRCLNIATGELDNEKICGYDSCGSGWTCVEGIGNPNYGSTHFDDIFTALLTVFQCVSMEGWTDTQLLTIRAFGPYAVLFYVPLILGGSFFLVNFTLAVIKSKVAGVYEENRRQKQFSNNRSVKDVFNQEQPHREVEKKVSLAQLLGIDYKDIETCNRQIVPFSLSPRKGNTKTYLARLEFPDIEKEVPFESKPAYNIGMVKVMPIHEEVIREEEESVIDISSMHRPAVPVCKKSNKKHIKRARKIGETLTKQIELTSAGSKRKLALGGMIGIRSDIPTELKTAFCGIEELDEFTETFFAQQNNPAELTVLQEGSEQHRIENTQQEYSEPSFNDLEASQFLSISKDVTPINGTTPPPILPLNFPQPFQTAQGNCDSLKGTFKKETTTSTSMSSSNDAKAIKPKFQPLKLILPDKEETEKALSSLDRVAEDSSKTGGNERSSEKFVLKEGIVLLTSEFDVQPRKSKALNALNTAEPEIPPYKLKVLYDPTQLPEEEDLEALQETINKTLRRTLRRRRTGSIPGSISSVSRCSFSLASAREKGKKRRKGKKKGTTRIKRNETNSWISSEGTPQKQSQAVSIKTGQVSGIISEARKSNDTLVESAISLARKPDNAIEVHNNLEQPPLVKEKPNVKRFLWSGQEVIPLADPYYAVYATSYINKTRIWKQGWEGTLKKARNLAKALATSNILEGIMNLFVVINTITLAMYRYDQPQSEVRTLNILNIIFTSIFTVEMIVKIFGLGLVGYLSDPLNYLDGAVVIFGNVEIAFLEGQGTLSALRMLRIFRSVRMIRAFRVLRVARLLRSFRSMQTIIEVIGKTIGSFAYIGLLMLIVMFIYALFGMQLFAGKFAFPGGTPRQNFDTFNNAILTMFQVLTMENWHEVLYDCMRARSPALSATYLITWIFIGNYILLNLFLAIMLDAFTVVDEEIGDVSEESEEEEDLDVTKSKIGTSLGGTLRGPGSRTSSIRSKSQFFRTTTKHKSIRNDDLDIEELTNPPKDDTLSGYKKLESIYSLYLFHTENSFRLFCWKVCTHTYFEAVILTLICLSSIKLAVDTYFLRDSNDLHTQISNTLNIFFTVAFALEALVKIIAYGFLFEPTTYLRDFWNQLDFFIVVASIVDALLSQVDIPMIRVLRLLRTLRPLRFVSHNVSMRVIVSALFKSLGAIINTMIVVIVVWLMFSIVGVSFFAGKFQYCSIDPYQNSNKEECVANKGEWRTYDTNFDNSINGLIALFILTTQENWPIIMYQAVDCTDVDKGPSVGGQWYYAYYFVTFLLVGSMFLLNLFVGIMFLNFTKVQKHKTTSFGDIFVTEAQLNWIEVQKMVVRAEPEYNARTLPPKYSWRNPFHQMVTSNSFDVVIAVIVLLNMVAMSLFYEGSSEGYRLGLEIINYVFMGVYTVEFVLKLIAFSYNFWYEAWNVFEFIIVICGYVDIAFSSTDIVSLDTSYIVRILKALRILRLLRLIKKYQRLQDIMEIIQLCLPSMMNIFALLTLVLFIYAVLGCYLFGNITTGTAINDFYNFSNFTLAIILCLKIATGEDWNSFMFDCAREETDCAAGLGCGNIVAFIYFLSFKLVITFVMLNLFILIVLQLFDKLFISKDGLLSKFKEDFAVFQEAWRRLAPTHSGFMINQSKLIRFFSGLPPPMGMEGMDLNDVVKEIILLGIRSNETKDVFFNELMYFTMRRQYSKMFRMNEFIRNKERETRRKIQAMAERIAKQGRYRTTRRTFIRIANPFVSLMLLRMTMKLWMKYNRHHKEKVEEYASEGILNYESSREEDLLPTAKVLLSPNRERSVNGNSR